MNATTSSNMNNKWAFSSLIVSSILLAGCTPSTYGPVISEQDVQTEEMFQRQKMDEIRAQGGLPQTWRKKQGTQKQFETVADKVEKAGADICREMGLPAQNYRCYYYFHFASLNPEINASADGTNIDIPLGMMRFVQNDDELAYVMGHELAHNLMHHIDSKNKNSLLGKMAGEVLNQVAPGASRRKDVPDAATAIGFLSYSPAFEREADYIGAYIAARAGYDVSKAMEFTRRMSYQKPENADGGLGHPANAERFVSLRETIKEIEYKKANYLPLIPNVKP